MDANAPGDKDEILPGPVKLALSPQGVEEFLSRNQKLKKYRFFDATEQYGLELPSISSKVLQRMAMTGTINRIERPITSYAHQRKAVMQLTRYFGYAMLYRQFEIKLHETFYSSELVSQWNRQYPKLTIHPDTNTSAPAFQLLLSKAQEGILGLKQGILAGLQAKIQANPKKLAEEKRQGILQTIRYLNAIDPVVWLLLTLSKDELANTVFLQDVKVLLASYIERSELPEYLALMLAELIMIVGNVTSMGLSAPLTETADYHEPVFVSYELGTLRKSQEEKLRVRIVLGNQRGGASDLRARMEGQTTSSTGRERSLDSYFGEGRNQDIGLMYLSYVQETCKRMNIFLDSFVNQVPSSRQTLVNLNMTL